MPKKNKSGKCNKKGGAFHSAPNQGIGLTENWTINDLAVVVLPQNLTPGPYTVRIACDANGFSWNVSNNGTLIASEPSTTYFQYNEPYGSNNSQFSRLSLLWEQYRTDAIEMEVIPSGQTDTMSTTGMFSLIDEANLLGGKESLGDLIPKLSSQRTLELHTPYLRVKKSLNLNKWIGQTQNTAWLQTQQAGTTQILREQYNTQWISAPTTSAQIATTPALCLAFGINLASSVQQFAATVRFRTRYTFRQRAALQNGPQFDQLISFDKRKDGSVWKVLYPKNPPSLVEYKEGHGLGGSNQTLEPEDADTKSHRSDLTASTRDRLIAMLA